MIDINQVFNDLIRDAVSLHITAMRQEHLNAIAELTARIASVEGQLNVFKQEMQAVAATAAAGAIEEHLEEWDHDGFVFADDVMDHVDIDEAVRAAVRHLNFTAEVS